METQLLNQVLYMMLVAVFKDVRVVRAGEAMKATIRQGDRFGSYLDIEEPGEEYIVSCPICDDTRHRLYINHRWGYDDPDTGRNIHLANCYNGGCPLSENGNRMKLYKLVYSFKNVEQRDIALGKMVVTEGRVQVDRGPPRLPGLCYPVNELPPNHMARQYLTNRDFDADVMASAYNVSYCVEAEDVFPLAEGRLVIPIYMRGELAGWQARYVGNRTNWDRLPKYYTMPGSQTSRRLYNYDVARRFRCVAVCEGVTDVWRVGDIGVALFGANMSQQQRDLILETWGNGLILLLLDPDKAGEKGTVKAIDRLGVEKENVITIKLQPGRDPCSYTFDALWDIIDGQLGQRGINRLDYF